MLDRLPQLPEPQRDALATALGLRSGPAPDHFLVGLAVLSLLSEAAEGGPLVCFVDDWSWLDRASGRALAFAARRLLAEPVLLLIAAREPGDDLRGLPELAVEGLPDVDARELLASVARWPLDERVRERMPSEARGNPLALRELPHDQSLADLAGSLRRPQRRSLADRIEERFWQQIAGLPADTVRLLRIAAADPVGDVARVWSAGRQLGVPVEAATPAVEAGLIEFATWARFSLPLVRSAAYQTASLEERQEVHCALAEATDPSADPDGHAWHRAQAAPGPDEDVWRGQCKWVPKAPAERSSYALACASSRASRFTSMTSPPGLTASTRSGSTAANCQATALRLPPTNSARSLIASSPTVIRS
jgi:hypothetical protein